MKRFTTNPFFYVSIVVIAVLVFQIAQIVRGQSRGVWTGPPGPPTAGQPAPPIDVSVFSQLKKGDLAIGPDDRNVVKISAGDIRQIFFVEDGTGVASIWLQRGSRKLMAQHADGSLPFELGSGSGGGDSLWSPGGTGDVFYTGSGKVGIGTNDPTKGAIHINVAGISEGRNDFNKGLGISYGGLPAAKLWVDSSNVFHLQRGDSTSRGLSLNQTGDFTAHQDVRIEGSLGVTEGILQYPSMSATFSGVCASYYAAVRYKTEGVTGRTWLQVGGADSGGNWGGGGCFSPFAKTVSWRWSRTTGVPRFTFEYIQGPRRYKSELTLSPNMKDGDVILLTDDSGNSQRVDSPSGGTFRVDYGIKWTLFDVQGYEIAP